MTIEKPETPVLDEMLRLRDTGWNSTIQGFIDWLQEHRYAIVRRCDSLDHQGSYHCANCQDSGYSYEVSNFERLMCEVAGIDRDQAERERLALLEYVRSQP